MKFSIILCAAVGMALCVACSNKESEVRNSARESLNVESPSAPGPETNISDFQTPPAAVAGVHHYICPNNCEGSGGATQVNCPVCGTQYVHNAAYHNQPANTAPATNTPGNTLGTTPPANATPPAAQNAAGVYHYTCPNGCEGGAGAAGSCASCGAALVHNSAYHQ